MRILYQLLLIVLAPAFVVFAVFEGILAFVKEFISEMKDWSDML